MKPRYDLFALMFFLSRFTCVNGITIPGNPNDLTGEILGYVGMVGALAMFASPLPTIRRILIEKTVSDFSEVPYILSTCNCALWVSYTIITPGRVMPLITNALGLIAELVYCLIFILYSEGEVHRRITTRIGGVSLFLTTVVIFAYVVLPALNIAGFLSNGDSAATDFLGILSSTFNTLMYGSPLSVMFLVIKTKSVEFMPLPLTVMTSVCCITWGLYAFYVGDIFIGIPNYAGIVLCLFQYILYATYYSSTPMIQSSSQNDVRKSISQKGSVHSLLNNEDFFVDDHKDFGTVSTGSYDRVVISPMMDDDE